MQDLLVLALAFITFVVPLIHLAVAFNLASAVQRDAQAVLAAGGSLRLGGPLTWFWATVLGSVLSAGVYWYVQHGSAHAAGAEDAARAG